MNIDEINALGEKILNHWALTDTRQLGLQACEIAAQLLSERDRLTAENERLKAYRTPIDVPPNEDGEYWCPKCNNEIVGYYTEYCEHCGQSVDCKQVEDE